MTNLLITAIILLGSLFPPKKSHVIFFGDSITELGVQPGGYITRIDSMCAAERKKDQYQFTGAGVSGNKIYDLYLRLEKDVLKKSPDLVIIYIGVNDVWHKQWGTGTDDDKFQEFYQEIINKIKEKGSRIILCTPAVIGERTDFSNILDGDLNNMSNIVRKIAKQNNLPLVDLRKIFLEYNSIHNKENLESGILTVDKVHPSAAGNQLIAEKMWEAIKSL